MSLLSGFRLASLNLFNYLAPPGAYYEQANIYSALEWQRKQGWLHRYLAELAPDVVAMQEVFSPNALAQQCHALGLTHFVCLDQAKQDEFVHFSPPVALASRFPIRQARLVHPDPRVLQWLALPDFAFSRHPLWVELNLPGFGPLQLVVVHLKSARPDLPDPPQDDSPLSQLWLRPRLGHWHSAQQRGQEAAVLMATLALQARPGPLVVLGDFNDQPQSETLRLFQRSLRRPLLPPGWGMSEQALEAHLAQWALADGFELAKAQGSRSAPVPTHYWGPHGSRIDHVLLSGDFDSAAPQSLASVADAWVADRHLVRPDGEADRQCSDHAAVVMDIEVRH
ncbi:endonuclease/exonuclease/phosphatase family protein [Ferrimonas marina]|uniref:Metal-dependent hydrolase, endonuclease/exonuclease/phosphatase family n=1 Tax=Ferrimonas marina TaxID=299255 RepID=A0A1M5MF14_9GAMM|nr:endonuclease/exonuclease/phosphatase family protein [Ferrimonas marina]SHG75836.1 Metal-dependent hydrolase, endonuclease/exonuclease/phosphatase family [Ferrimonas marina]